LDPEGLQKDQELLDFPEIPEILYILNLVYLEHHLDQLVHQIHETQQNLEILVDPVVLDYK
jgi:hypothetical protein